MDSDKEKELIEKAGTDIEAFGQLYDRYYGQISNYILKRTANVYVAQDITSDVFFKALNNIRRFQWRNIPFSAWLYSIANNEIADHYRENGHNHSGIDSLNDSIRYAGPSPEAEIQKAEEELKKHNDFILMQKMISRLSIKYQEVITLRYFDDKKISEIAEILNKREGTVKSLIHRGLEKLRKLMEENATFS